MRLKSCKVSPIHKRTMPAWLEVRSDDDPPDIDTTEWPEERVRGARLVHVADVKTPHEPALFLREEGGPLLGFSVQAVRATPALQSLVHDYVEGSDVESDWADGWIPKNFRYPHSDGESEAKLRNGGRGGNRACGSQKHVFTVVKVGEGEERVVWQPTEMQVGQERLLLCPSGLRWVLEQADNPGTPLPLPYKAEDGTLVSLSQRLEDWRSLLAAAPPAHAARGIIIQYDRFGRWAENSHKHEVCTRAKNTHLGTRAFIFKHPNARAYGDKLREAMFGGSIEERVQAWYELGETPTPVAMLLPLAYRP